MTQRLIKREDILALDLLDEDPLPPTWTSGHVGRRITEAMQTLRLLPMKSVGGYGSPWPRYVYEYEDLLAQHQQGELERTQQQQNRTRCSPSMRELQRADIAMYWPMKYLSDNERIAIAVTAVCFAHSIERDAGWVTKKRGGYADTWRSNHDRGCYIIARGLIKDCEPVW